jgi:hypothetical protein
MYIATWPSLKSSPMMQEIRESLKLKTEPGKPTPSRKEANRVWREDILGIRSEEQKLADKAKKQERVKRRKKVREEENYD